MSGTAVVEWIDPGREARIYLEGRTSGNIGAELRTLTGIAQIVDRTDYIWLCFIWSYKNRPAELKRAVLEVVEVLAELHNYTVEFRWPAPRGEKPRTFKLDQLDEWLGWQL